MLPVIQIEFLTIRTPGLALLAGLWFGLDVASRFAVRRGVNVDRAYSLGFWAAAAGLLAARLGFVLTHLNTYLKITPWDRTLGSAFALMPGTEIAPMGVLAALVTGWLLVRRWRMPLLETLDSYSVGLAVLGISIGAAALLGGEMYGLETSLPWAIDLWGGLRHPTQVYFALACLAIVVALWRVDRQKGRSLPPGTLTQLFLIMMGVTLLLVEPLRADSPVIFGSIRLWEVIGLAGIVAALAGFAIRAPETPGETAPDRAV
jgi:phosphatidylglycerol:prolipoprotein diacylglycerol transferase